MYTTEFRDKIYEGLTPRTANEHINQAIEWLNNHLPENVERLKILDYASRPGDIGGTLLKRGANVDFAEISSTMIDTLRQKFCYKSELGGTLDEKQNWGQARVFSVESPKDLPVEDGNYDYIIAWALFHHVSPEYWKEFLDNFGRLLAKDGKIIIAGWDETDIVLKQDGYKGHVTGQPSYTINSLPDYMNNELFEIEETGTFDQKIPCFDTPRTFRYFVVRYKQ